MADRRAFLAKVAAGGSALVGACLAGVAGVASVPKAVGAVKRWRKAASMFDIGKQPLMVVLADRHQDGWYQTQQQTIVYLDKEETGDGYRALSASCTHLGCGISWDQKKQQYLCPCHGGVFDRTGRVLAGPPPRAMDRFEARLNKETGDIEVEL